MAGDNLAPTSAQLGARPGSTPLEPGSGRPPLPGGGRPHAPRSPGPDLKGPGLRVDARQVSAPRLRTLRGRLWALALAGGVLVCATGATGLTGLREVAAREHVADRYEGALLLVQQVETARERLRAELAVAERSPGAPPSTDLVRAAEAYDGLLEQEAAGLPDDLAALLEGPHDDAHVVLAQVMAATAATGLAPPASTTVVALGGAYEVAADDISARAEGAEERAIAARHLAEAWLAGMSVLALAVLAVLAALIARAAVRRLGQVSGVAAAVTAGDLQARTGLTGTDEVAQVGRALDEMADTLQDLLRAQRVQGDEQEFGNRLAAALEHADTAAAVLEVAGRAMDVAGPDLPMELLLADSSRAHLQVSAISPSHGGPGCRVTSPHGCPAVRAGGAVVAESSQALDACPRLREREDAASAVCVPITFMGRALGVLHAAQPTEGLPPEGVVPRMRALASLTGSRLGTVQALASAELQASTDLLTGLSNRRTGEERLRDLQAARTPYGLGLLDLDHFKTINDTHGHEAGDRALRVFAGVLTSVLRDEDSAVRWGGEEFVLVLPGADVQEVVVVLERVRAQLGVALARHACPVFTVSAGVADSMSGVLPEEQLAVADAALLTAKRQGRDRVVVGGTVAVTAGPGSVAAAAAGAGAGAGAGADAGAPPVAATVPSQASPV